ncbi:bifunctional (p)ppGpp synthetase/guanosine-3',5'-bis(diphosphate) 3'-pyrophosphohydrolase [Cellulomonas sp. zg-ZUI222]|uniref:Bifunctional (P)ppGpp synthetase/guanosine-3',5'-bis(Diphosphate) 3'-pyrophosphohydrolase n=1 Tax=Cellulomonas wangleii TaxID=2816956 RepID=A0ABX8DAN8_9CELL|nr:MULTISPECIES: bifunctional (p)ppGpp synthetase/guanosine-3',5'-bis(diphosphate) 3'-pyrophosphohydrolase [Cellulomonas]MBO0900397.1 bifunctional (p)ppGpp synthetase/guanosine-3',5'-bis(diphosphate) 3'-pyrophosphohydrolase [Cellulomonas sp. zg-ZUI22]MBO0922773.1 bifunctional (p)ppGpp synthetase/guanosine-3',5'-bis(diphosphate) 3'-pyrophosphohydrolase [Cellulomonas wangleii]MBO0926362.1 bifunctional (p)ppGpp synthetase/guanosine-3',5'-bis(diphosphate) 3'-pyrophosphohydrolase [Cellulomonas wangle
MSEKVGAGAEPVSAPVPAAPGPAVPSGPAVTTPGAGTPEVDAVPGSTGRVRARLARLSGRSASAHPALEPVLQALRTNHPKADLSVIEQAYVVAEHAHRGQLRKSGDPYITHPVAVATILADLGMTPSTIVAALLHDTVEDTDYSLDQLRHDFGPEVAMLVDGVTKLDKVAYGDAAQAETVRKMVVAMSRDIRVLVIKLADRLHNARTWKFVSAASAEKKARETLEIYAPLAHRLGMNTIKWELEDLSFATLYPKVYDEIVHLVAERAPAREEYLATVRDQVGADLRTARIKATVTGRPKHYYSIYQKMIVRGREFADIYDLVGVRVLVDTVRDCYAALGALHARWNPVPGRFKDYIAMPKFNLYQSLHTTVIGPGGKPVEIQIRTHDMHRRAEYGVAAHWKYKETAKSGGPQDAAGNDMTWLRQLVDWQRETADPTEFLDLLRDEIAGAEVYVFTPKGDVQALPAGSTPVDFAYAVHTEVGHRTMGARVNGRLVPLDSTLENGDVVEVFTSKSETAGPSRDWLAFVKSPRARNKIRQWFTKERREEAIEQGKDAIAKAMRKQNLPIQRLMSHEALVALAHEMRFADVSALYAAVGEGQASATSVVQRLVHSLGGEPAQEEDLAEAARPGSTARRVRTGDPGVVVKGVEDVWVKLAKCCTPVPGDEIIGFVTRGAGVSVHRTDCLNVEGLRRQPERIVEVEWTHTSSQLFLVQIQVEALDRSRLLSDVTRVLSDHHVNILSASVSTSRDRVALSRFVFEMAEPSHLASVLAAVRKVEGVFDVYRVTGSRGAEEPAIRA